MLDITVTLASAVEAMTRIANREPFRVGQANSGSCVYATVEGGVLTPVCIVGQFLADEGLLRLLVLDNRLATDFEPEPYKSNPDQEGACTISNNTLWDRLAEHGFNVEPEARQFLHDVQVQQDDGLVWGKALREGVKQYRARVLQQAEANLNRLVPSIPEDDEDDSPF